MVKKRHFAVTMQLEGERTPLARGQDMVDMKETRHSLHFQFVCLAMLTSWPHATAILFVQMTDQQFR